MNIGYTVRFLNDIGGGKISAFKPGGIVIVEDEDGFEVPMPADEIVVIETNALNIKKKPVPKVEYGAAPSSSQDSSAISIAGKEYLKSKDQRPTDTDEEVDENLEARVLRLEMTIRKLELRLSRREDAKAAREKEKIEARQARKQMKDEIIEIDLHAHEVLETTSGMSAGDIKEYQLTISAAPCKTIWKRKAARLSSSTAKAMECSAKPSSTNSNMPIRHANGKTPPSSNTASVPQW